MGTTRAGVLSAAFGLVLAMAALALGDEVMRPGLSPGPRVTDPYPAGEPPAQAPAGGVVPGAGTRAEENGPGPSPAIGPPAEDRSAAKEKKAPDAAGDAEARAARAEVEERLKRLTAPSDQDPPAVAASANKALREVLEERRHWLDEWDKVARPANDPEAAEPNPERKSAEIKADLERVKALLDQSAKQPDALLPAVFRKPAGAVNDAARAEMKEALDAAKAELNDWRAKQEELRAAIAKAGNSLPPLRVERDKIHQRVAALKSRLEERQAAVAAARSPEDAALARERLINFTWETRVESARLAVQEAKLAQESSRAGLMTLRLQLLDAHAQLATRTLDRMQDRYRAVSAAQERTLQQAAAKEQRRAESADDPLVKYRAQRTAGLLDLQAEVLKFENALATNPYPALDEQRSLADRAVDDLAKVRKLLADGKVSHLDALRLNNDFRRIKPERARIVGHELAAASSQLTFYENALSGVEIELINDARDDRLQGDDLLARLPRTRWDEARKLFQEIEARHLALLERKREALEKLASRAEETHRQIERRLQTLDEQYGLIRTHIFWVRDQEPIGALALARCRREMAFLGRALLPLFREAFDPTRWGRVSPEFIAAMLGLIGLPWPLYRLRRSLRPHRRHAPRA